MGKYKKGEKVEVWKTTFEDKIYQKDKVRKNVTKMKIYHANRKIMEKGQSDRIFLTFKDIGIISAIGNILMKMEK